MTPRDIDTDLERVIDEALAGLPMPTAPRTLAPRVLRAAAYRAQQAPPVPVAAGWFAWSAGARLASAALFVAVLALAAWLGTHVQPFLTAAVSEPSRAAAVAAAAIDRPLLEVLGFVGPLWHVVGEPIAGVALVLIVAMLAACVAGTAALEHLTLGEPTP